MLSAWQVSALGSFFGWSLMPSCTLKNLHFPIQSLKRLISCRPSI